jgi:hypothetical protein
MSKKLNLDAMSVVEKWNLHVEIVRMLSELEKRLAQLQRENEMPQSVDNKSRKEASSERRRRSLGNTEIQ